MTFAEEGSPAFFAGAFDVVQSTYLDEPKVAEAFRTGKGVGWHEHSKCLFSGTERFFRPGYNANLVSNWIPTLEGVEAKLKAGARVADVGCGHGASTIVMAQAYPNSEFFGFDYHKPSIERAKVLAQEAGVGDRITFAQASAKDFPAKDYDLVAFFDCLHDMGDPVGAGKHVKETLAKDGSWMIVEPFAHDNLKDNLNPVGCIFYHASTFICTPASLSQEVGLGLGAQAGESRLRQVATELRSAFLIDQSNSAHQSDATRNAAPGTLHSLWRCAAIREAIWWRSGHQDFGEASAYDVVAGERD
jgi:SAM-dependent methyltransferase